MSEIGFYHLTRSSLEQALPALLGRTLAAGERAFVLCPDQERLAALDDALWLATSPDWLPHGTRAMGHAAYQPIWLDTEDGPPPNGARFLFLVAGAESRHLDLFTRVFDLFDGNDPAAVERARARYRAARAAGHRLTYWRQTEVGWEKQAG